MSEGTLVHKKAKADGSRGAEGGNGVARWDDGGQRRRGSRGGLRGEERV